MAKKQNSPQETPPAQTSSQSESTKPVDQLPQEDANLNADTQTSAPSEEPPTPAFSTEEGYSANGIWYQNKKITALWTIDQSRNSWAAVSGLGWRKIDTKNDSSTVALTILAAHAKDRNRNVKLRIDNNRIVEMYVW